jgi:hypothetical protein
MLFARKVTKLEKPMCRVHGPQMTRKFLGKTLVFGWWGVISLFVNLFIVAGNIKALGAFRDLDDPSAPGSTPTSPVLVNKALIENTAPAVRQGEWRPDPYARHQFRWVVGSEWSDQVCDGDQVSVDPPGWVQRVPPPPVVTP